MRRIGMVVALVALLAGISYASGTMNPTNGLDVYREQMVYDSNPNHFVAIQILAAHVGAGWTLDSTNVLVDNQTTDQVTWPNWWPPQAPYGHRTPSMLDPRADRYTGAPTGGTGRVMYNSIDPLRNDPTHGTWSTSSALPNAGDPNNAGNFGLLSYGQPGYYVGGTFDGWASGSGSIGAVWAPNNLGGKNSHGLAYLQTDWDYGTRYLFDADGNGRIDNDSTASAGPEAIYMSGGDFGGKPSWGPDNALYRTGGVPSGVGLNRQYIDPTTGTASAVKSYANLTSLQAAYPWIRDDQELGGAVYPYILGMTLGPSHTEGVAAPIVYLGTMTTTLDEANPEISSTKISILAVQDMDGDNEILAGGPDVVSLVWRSSQWGVSMSWDYYHNEDASMNDIRYDPVSQSIVMTNAWGEFAVISLDNTTGLNAIGGIQFGGIQSGYLGGGHTLALDPTPFVSEIPEPATLLLVGTGALGVFGYIRRRRMV